MSVRALAAVAGAVWLSLPAAAAEPLPPIQARGVLSPRVALFGDTITAHVDVNVDRRRVDPDSVRVDADFLSWRAVEPPRRERNDAQTTTHLRATYVLRCLSTACVPSRAPLRLELDPATVTYRAGSARGRLEVRWPVLAVHSRLDPTEPAGADAPGGPWRAEVVSLPAVSFRVAPGLALAAFLATGVAFGAAGLWLAYRAFPRRRRRVLDASPPPPRLSPLEHALALLESPASADGSGDRRRALELVATELAGSGHDELAWEARALAWSEDAPAAQEARSLAVRVRGVVEPGGEGRDA